MWILRWSDHLNDQFAYLAVDLYMLALNYILKSLPLNLLKLLPFLNYNINNVRVKLR